MQPGLSRQPGRVWLPRPAVLMMTALLSVVGSTAATAHVKWFCAYDLAGAPRGLGEVLCADFEKLVGLSLLALVVGGLLEGTVLGAALIRSLDRATAWARDNTELLFRAVCGGFFVAGEELEGVGVKLFCLRILSGLGFTPGPAGLFDRCWCSPGTMAVVRREGFLCVIWDLSTFFRPDVTSSRLRAEKTEDMPPLSPPTLLAPVDGWPGMLSNCGKGGGGGGGGPPADGDGAGGVPFVDDPEEDASL